MDETAASAERVLRPDELTEAVEAQTEMIREADITGLDVDEIAEMVGELARAGVIMVLGWDGTFADRFRDVYVAQLRFFFRLGGLKKLIARMDVSKLGELLDRYAWLGWVICVGGVVASFPLAYGALAQGQAAEAGTGVTRA